MLWGRSVFSNIRKFLQFQLTVNGVALVLAFVAAITSGETPLNVLQLLWVNLIMDALGALGALCYSNSKSSLSRPRIHTLIMDALGALGALCFPQPSLEVLACWHDAG